MIEVQPFIDKLERLKEYMNMRIELQVMQLRETETFWKLYKETGMMFAAMAYKTEIPTFDFYLKFPETLTHTT